VRAAAQLRNVLLRDADAFVAMSRRIGAEFEAAGVTRDRIALIPHGVDIGHFRPAGREEREALRARLRLPAGACIVAYSGRLLRGKGLEDLVTAFGRIVTARDVHLLVVGSGDGQSLSIEEALKEQVRAAGLDPRVTFVGRVNNVVDWLRASDVFAFPSVFEALGIALVEAAACGLPAVGARTGGIVDVIEDGVSGRLFTPGDVDGLATALARLADRPEERAAMGREARRIAERRFDAVDMVVRYRTLFAEIESRRRLGLPRGPATGKTSA
jgi:glycosyltransferase involved in cell wall biosynthesis